MSLPLSSPRTLSRLGRLLTTTSLIATGALAFMSNSAHADNWVDLSTTSGSTTTQVSNSTTNIDIDSGRAVMEGDLDINAGWSVNVGAGDLVAIDRENDPTYIYGQLNCAGSCHVLDRDGFIVGEGSIVNAASVTFATGDLIDVDGFMNSGIVTLGNFNADSSILIENGATISVAESGLAAFVSPTVINNGVINAKLATVAFAAGETVTLDLYGDGLVEIAVDGELADAYLENTGTINAEGGVVQMTALAAKDAVDNIINVEGVVTVASATQVGGKIILSGGDAGTVNVEGTLDASGTDGGSIDVSGENIVLADSAELLADGGQGQGKTGDGGDINVIADNVAIIEGRFSAQGGKKGGDGGFIETSAYNLSVGDVDVDASAKKGENGSWLLDPYNLTVVAGTGVTNAVLTPPGATGTSVDISATIGADTLVAALNGGTDVVLQTGASGAEAGDITIDAALNMTGSNDASLTLYAHNDIIVNESITSSGSGTLDVSFYADTDNSGEGAIVINNIIETNGGEFIANASDGVTIASVLSTSGGNITINTASTTWADYLIVTGSGSIDSDGGDIALESNSAGLILYGDVDAGNGDIVATGQQVQLKASTVTADEITLNAGAVSQASAGVVTANLLTGSTVSTVSMNGQNNIVAIGDFETGTGGWSKGGFSLNNVSGSKLSIVGAITASGDHSSAINGDASVSITNDARIDVDATGSIETDGGDIALTVDANAFMYLNGLIDSGSGDTTLDAGSTIIMENGGIINADTLTTIAKTVSQDAGAMITANLLEGSLQKSASFLGTNNDIVAIGDFETGLQAYNNGGFVLVDTNGLTISGTLSTAGTAAANGDGVIDIQTTSSSWSDRFIVSMNGSIESNGAAISLTNQGSGQLVIHGNVGNASSLGDVTLSSGGSMQFWNGSTLYADTLSTSSANLLQWANSSITANKLTGSTSTYVELLGTSNDIAELGDFKTGLKANADGGFMLVDTNGLNITGSVSATGGDIVISTTGDIVFASTSSTTTGGGDLELTSSTKVDVDHGATIALVDGDGTFNAPLVNLGDDIDTTGTITGTAATVYVENSDAQIQDGVDVAASGATVNVAAGTYIESVTIDKTISLLGANAGIDPNSGVRGAETEVTASDYDVLTVYGDDVIIDGFTLHGDNDLTTTDGGVWGVGADDIIVRNNIIEGAEFGIYLSGDGTVSRGLIENNRISNIHGDYGQGIHVRNNQYADIKNNTIFDAEVGIATEFHHDPLTDGGDAPEVSSNSISAEKIGIRSNPVTGNGTGYLIQNNTITAEIDPTETRRWTGIDIVSQRSTTNTTFLNNTIDGTALNGSGRLVVGYEATNVESPNVVIDGGSVTNVDYGVWATDGSGYTGEVNNLLIKNVAFSNISNAAILAEDTIGYLDNSNKDLGNVGTVITIGAGNTYSNIGYELELAGSDVTVNFDGIDGVNSVFVRGAGTATYGSAPYGETTILENENASIQKGIDYVVDGGSVTIDEGTFTEGNINIDKSVKISGAGSDLTNVDATGYANGFVINSDLGVAAEVSLSGVSVENASNNGFLVTSAAILDTLTLDDASFVDNGLVGLAVYGDGVGATSVLNSDFLNNGVNSTSGGDGDILFYEYNGDIHIKNVAIEGNTADGKADYGIQIRGSATGGAYADSGEIILDNVTVSGNYRAALLGIQRYTNPDISFTDVTLGGATATGTASTGWGSLYLSELDSATIDINDTEFLANNSQYIVLGSEAGSPDVDARDATFEGVLGSAATLTQSFALEDKIAHDMDGVGLGHVFWNDDDDYYATVNNLGIQRAVDLSSVGGQVWVGNGTFNENVTVDKAITITGTGTTNTTTLDGTGLGGTGFTLAADDISLNGMIIQNFNYALNVASDIANLALDDILARQNNTGLKVSSTASILDNSNDGIDNGLYVTNSHFDQNEFGWYFAKKYNAPDASTVTGVNVSNTTFNNNAGKGIYAEKLNDATFTNITVDSSGIDPTTWYHNVGVDINLKNGDYQNIVFDGLTITNSGANAYDGTYDMRDESGVSLWVKARNDGATYSLNPASLTGLVIKNSDITAAGDVAIAIGNNVSDVTIADNSNITGAQGVTIYGGVKDIDILRNTINANGSSVGVFEGNDALTHGIGFNQIIDGDTILIEDNIISSANAAVAFNEKMTGGSDVQITNNTLSGAYGLLTSVLSNAVMKVTGGSITSTNDGIRVNGSIGTSSELHLTNQNIQAGDEGVDVDGIVHGLLDVTGGSIVGAGSGIEANKVSGTIRITNATVEGNHATHGQGINILRGFSGTLDIDNSTITGGYNGIGSDSGSFDVNGGHITIANGSVITGTNSDGIEVNDLTNSSTLSVTQSTVSGAENGIELGGVSSGSVVTISNNVSITGGDNGILFGSNGSTSVDGGSVVIDTNDLIEGGNGIQFAARVKGSGKVEITNNTQIEGTAGDGILFGGQVDLNNGTDRDLYIAENDMIRGSDNGIHTAMWSGWFNHASHDTLITGNTIVGLGDAGINIGGSIYAANVRIIENDAITGANDGIRVDGTVKNGATLNISENTSIEGTSGDAIDLDGLLNGGHVIIDDNDTIVAGTNGILIDGEMTGDSTITITKNTINQATDGSGISVTDTTYGGLGSLLVDSNVVAQAGVDGIFLNRTSNATVTTNYIGYEDSSLWAAITEVDDDGIEVKNTQGADIAGNWIINTGDEGVAVLHSTDARIRSNNIQEAGGNGILDYYNTGTEITANTVNNAGVDGIGLNNSYNSHISYNNINDARGDGIFVIYNEGAYIHDNTIMRPGDDGIDVRNHDHAVISTNTVESSHDEGIIVSNSDYAQITNGNIVRYASGTGIVGYNAYGVTISGNTVEGGLVDGIGLNYSDNSLVSLNTVTSPRGDGLFIVNSDDVTVSMNTITGAGDDGIDAKNSSKIDIINNNNIQDSGDNGIAVSDSGDVTIDGNTIYDTVKSGIYVASNDTVLITDNLIGDADAANYDIGAHGIESTENGTVEISEENEIYNAAFTGIYSGDDDTLIVDNNIIDDIGDAGVYAEHFLTSEITDNTISNTGGNAIFADGWNDDDRGLTSLISGNIISNAGGNGITASYTDDLVLSDNEITDVIDYGIEAYDSGFVSIDNNSIDRTGEHGIIVRDSAFADITDNVVTGAGFYSAQGFDLEENADSIYVEGVYGYNSGADTYPSGAEPYVEITGNTINTAEEDGISVVNSGTLLVSNNELYDAAANGILIDTDSETISGVDSEIVSNIIENSGEIGLYVAGDGNDDVSVRGNTFTDNPVAALFESGEIDLSDLTAPNTIENTDPLATPVGLAFNEVGDAGTLSLTDFTFGNTIFSGFETVGSYYIRLEDGSFLDPVSGSPIVLNGLDASYDGLIPSSTGGILSEADLDYLETRIYDADDAPTDERGNVFVGALSEDTLLDVEDFFNQFGGFNSGSSGFNITITALPSLTGATGLNAAGLNQIAPAAGGTDDEATDEELASLEPAAGGDEVSCWSDAAGAADGGSAVNFRFGGTFEDSLAAASGCSSSEGL